MTNFLDNGTVMPHGLLSCSPSDFLRGFNKSYNNTALRFGVIKQIYPVSNPKNIGKLTTEYDVEVIEQDMNRGIAPITYKNCMSIDSLGSIADFFEKNFRAQTRSDNLQLPLTKGQNGATVLVLCLDATTGKGIVLGGLNHPDRPTTLHTSDPHLQGEYNGVQVVVNADGSTSLTFQGATDNDGNIIDTSQGITDIRIEKDGSFQIQHDTVTLRLDKTGTVSLKAKKDLEMAITGNVSITLNGDATINAQGKCDIISSGKTTLTASEIDLNGSAGKILTTATDKVVDTIYGTPTVGVPTVKSG